MLRYKLCTLLVLLAVAPAVLAVSWSWWHDKNGGLIDLAYAFCDPVPATVLILMALAYLAGQFTGAVDGKE